jgi:hypothetical protein
MASFTFKYASDHHDLAIEFRVLNFSSLETQSGHQVGSVKGQRHAHEHSVLAIDSDRAAEMRRERYGEVHRV